MTNYNALPDAMLLMGTLAAGLGLNSENLEVEIDAAGEDDLRELVVTLAAIAVGLADVITEDDAASLLQNMAKGGA